VAVAATAVVPTATPAAAEDTVVEVEATAVVVALADAMAATACRNSARA